MGLPVPKPKPSVVLTRPRAQAEQFALDLRARGFGGEIVISPLLKIEGTGQPVDLANVECVVFTSRNAIEFVPAQKMPAWCVGAKTAEAARERGWDAISANGSADDLLNVILHAKPTGRFLHLRGEHSRGDVTQRLREAGHNADEVVVYLQVEQPLSQEAKALLSGEIPVIVPLFSRRTAALFAKNAPFKAPVLGVAMSEAVAEEMREVGFERVIVAATPDAKAMRNSVLSLTDAG